MKLWDIRKINNNLLRTLPASRNSNSNVNWDNLDLHLSKLRSCYTWLCYEEYLLHKPVLTLDILHKKYRYFIQNNLIILFQTDQFTFDFHFRENYWNSIFFSTQYSFLNILNCCWKSNLIPVYCESTADDERNLCEFGNWEHIPVS